MKAKKFPNGFTSWSETHYEVVSNMISILKNSEKQIGLLSIKIQNIEYNIYEFAERLTDEFENINKGREWDGEFFDEVENFVKEKLS